MVSIWRGVSKEVEDCRMLPTLSCGRLNLIRPYGRLRAGRLQGVEG